MKIEQLIEIYTNKVNVLKGAIEAEDRRGAKQLLEMKLAHYQGFLSDLEQVENS